MSALPFDNNVELILACAGARIVDLIGVAGDGGSCWFFSWLPVDVWRCVTGYFFHLVSCCTTRTVHTQTKCDIVVNLSGGVRLCPVVSRPTVGYSLFMAYCVFLSFVKALARMQCKPVVSGNVGFFLVYVCAVIVA